MPEAKVQKGAARLQLSPKQAAGSQRMPLLPLWPPCLHGNDNDTRDEGSFYALVTKETAKASLWDLQAADSVAA